MPDYDLNTESINSFIDDNQIELPRFQRKLTWNSNDNFKLCLSVFKGYPLGVIVLSKDKQAKYLLDGRQRRNALDQMRNPENIYDWAKSGIGFNVDDSDDDVRRQYWAFVDDYFGEETVESDDESETDDQSGESSSQNGENEDSTIATAEREDENIKDLLEIILMVHEKRGKTSGMTKPFDFKNYVSGLDYIGRTSNGNRYVDTERLIDWIDYRSDGRGTPDLDQFDRETFYEWLMRGKVPGEGDTSKEETIKRHIDRRWNRIVNVLEQLQTLNAMLSNRKIAYLEVRDVTANDEKKIFEIINSEGTDLTAVEILSAKPAFNLEIENPSDRLLTDIDRLYEEEMGVKQKGAVRWDRPATVYERLEVGSLLPSEGYGFERRVRIGFKLMSGYYLNGISKDEFEKLASQDHINWGSIELEQSINRMEDLLTEHALFKFWTEWPDPLIRLSSEAVTVNYILCILRLWEELGRPSSSSSALDTFRNKGVALLDRLIYEYVTQRWRGSSDTRVANNLANFSEDTTLFEPVATDDWREILEELVYQGQIDGRSQLDNKNPTNEVKLILRYYYVLCGQRPSSDRISVDHVIPKKKFESAAQDNLKRYKHHIANLAEIPFNDNVSKGTKTLAQIDDPWLTSEITKFTGIDESDFDEYVAVTDVEQLVEVRGTEIIETFIERRREMLSVA